MLPCRLMLIALLLSSACTPPECEVDADCDDNDMCTTESCGEGECLRPEIAGDRCQLCRTPVGEGRRVFVCSCGALLHHDDERVAEGERLECATLPRECPKCRAALELKAGFEYVPELH